MRPALLAAFAVLVSPISIFAQSPYLAIVSDPEVKLRAGNSDTFPETGTLTKGTRVVVDHEEGNSWLAIVAPAGSVSWVQNSLIEFDNSKPTPQNVVVSDETTLAAGKIDLPQPMLQVRRAKVPAGTILTVIGAKVQFDGKIWYPVHPPAGDFRFIPRHAVQYEKSANTNFTVRETSTSTPAGGSATGIATVGASGMLPPAASATTSAGKPASNNPLWAQAEAAERDGRYEDAEKAYFQLARIMNEPGGDHDTANLCYTRIHNLREKKRGGTTTSNGTARPAPREPIKSAGGSSSIPSTEPRAEPRTEPRDERAKWMPAGKLVRSALSLDDRKTYALESSPGVTMMYVVGVKGLDLDRYVGKKVELYGLTATRNGLSKPYVIASAVE